MSNNIQHEYIEMKFGPKWPYVSTIRIFMQNFLTIATGNQKKADKIAMAVSELVENAVKYSENSETHLRITMDSNHEKVEVNVKNRANPEQAGMLVNFLNELNGMSPLEAYMEKMRVSVGQSKSQLGLARIRYEAGADIRAEFTDGIVDVAAWFQI